MSIKILQKVIKRWQDEIANEDSEAVSEVYREMAVDDILRVAPYPRPVAAKMISGELPMTASAIAKRSAEQNYGGTMFRGHKASGAGREPRSDVDMFMTDDESVAGTYSNAWKDDGTITPLRHNAGTLLEIDMNGGDYQGVELLDSYIPKLDGKELDDFVHDDFGTDAVGRAVKHFGADGVNGVRFKNILDDHDLDDEQATLVPSTVENVFGSRPGVNIRHADMAAFDPEYDGMSIYGSLLAGGLGLGALSQSEDADASIARLANRGLRLVERDSEYADRLFGVVDEQGGKIGRADFEIMPEGHLEAYEMAIYPQHQGNGIMNEVYDAVEEITDRKIEPSGSLTDDGQKFWIRRDPAKMREYLKGTTSEDRLDSLFEDALSKSKDADDRLINIAERGNATVPMLGATAAGTAGLLAAPALMKDGIFQHTASETPIVERKEPVRNQSGLLESVTDFGDEVFKSVRHAAGPLADVFMPYEGVNNYLKTVNDADRQPTWWDRLGLLDL